MANLKSFKTYYIGFYQYDDTKTWNITRLNENKEDLETYLFNLQYINKASINIKDIELPEKL